jgi:hypothetical protein
VQAPAWLHPITDLQTASSIGQLQGMITHPSRYDYTYLAAALHRLSELTEQQRQAAAAAGPLQDSAKAAAAAAARADLALGSRLAKKLFGRLQQLSQDGTAAELACVLAAAARMGTLHGETYAAAAAAFANGPQLQQATDTQLAAVMYSVAAFSSSCTAQGVSAQASGFPKQQQHAVLKECASQVCRLLQRQQQQVAAASGAAATAAAGAASIEPSTVVMTVWALATAGVRAPKAITRRLFDFLGQASSVTKLTGSSGSKPTIQQQQQQQQLPLDEVARTCCTVVWAAAQLQYTQQDMSLAAAYVAGFMRALPATSVACSSIATVLQSVASLLAAARQQQQQQQQQQQGLSAAGAADPDHWRSFVLRCSDEVIRRLQQQQQQQQLAAGAAASSSSSEAEVCAASAAYQVVWAYQVADMRLPDSQLQSMLELLGDQVSERLIELCDQMSCTPMLHQTKHTTALTAFLPCLRSLQVAAAVLPGLGIGIGVVA